MATVVTPNEEKLEELILYIAGRLAEDPYFGATKLNKILYMIDAFAYAQLGKPVTGVEYMKLEQGPVPRRLLPVKRGMINKGACVEQERPAFGMPKPQKRLVPLRPPRLGDFAPEEIAHIDEIIDACRGVSGTQLSGMTHQWRGWKMARSLGDTIPYGAIFLSDYPVTDYERVRAEDLIAEHGWDVR